MRLKLSQFIYAIRSHILKRDKVYEKEIEYIRNLSTIYKKNEG